jgi:hypothetical protein
MATPRDTQFYASEASKCRMLASAASEEHVALVLTQLAELYEARAAEMKVRHAKL